MKLECLFEVIERHWHIHVLPGTDTVQYFFCRREPRFLLFSYYSHMPLCNERKKKINKIHSSLKAKELCFPILRHLANLIFLQMLLDIN